MSRDPHSDNRATAERIFRPDRIIDVSANPTGRRPFRGAAEPQTLRRLIVFFSAFLRRTTLPLAEIIAYNLRIKCGDYDVYLGARGLAGLHLADRPDCRQAGDRSPCPGATARPHGAPRLPAQAGSPAPYPHPGRDQVQ